MLNASHPSIGNVGIGTAAPTDNLSVNGMRANPAVDHGQTFSDERLKKIRAITTVVSNAVMQLQPVRYEYKPNNALGIKSEGEHIGFGAQAVQQVIPEAVTKNAKVT